MSVPEVEAHLTFVLGGARSGKSRHAESLVTAYPAPWTYIATAQALDAEMQQRIVEHRARRGAGWETRNVPFQLASMLLSMQPGRPVLVDCLTLWLTNIMLADHDVEAEIQRLVTVLASPGGPWVIVANEVGLGIVPDNALARAFRDHAGRLNQMVAEAADTVILTVAGLPMRVK